jgi:hypothetical protein
LTWPENTEKCFSNTKGECLSVEEMRNLSGLRRWGRWHEDEFQADIGHPSPLKIKDRQIMDLYRDRSRVRELSRHHSLGFPSPLDGQCSLDGYAAASRLTWDEYPLEIQCNRCFW